MLLLHDPSYLAVLALFNIYGIPRGVQLYRQFSRYREAGINHHRWKILWVCGCFLDAAGVVVYLLHGDGFYCTQIWSIGSILWIEAYVLFRRAKAQDAIPLPRYDDPQEGVWPPPPINPP